MDCILKEKDTHEKIMLFYRIIGITYRSLALLEMLFLFIKELKS